MLSITNPGSSAALKSDATGDEHIVYHRDADRAALLAALGQLDPDAGLAAIVAALGGKATDAGLAAIVQALGETLEVSAQSLPLPSGAATQATLASILAKLISAPATEAKQDTVIGFVDGIETALAAVLAKIIAAPATEAKQDVLVGHVDGIEALLTSLLAKVIAAPATEAKQDTIIGHVDGVETLLTSLLAQLRTATSHIAITPGATAIAGGPVRRLVIGGAGTITVTAGGQSVQYAVVAGQTLDIAATHVTAATATGIVGQF